MLQFFKDFFDKHPEVDQDVQKDDMIKTMFKKHYQAEEVEDQKIDVVVPYRCEITAQMRACKEVHAGKAERLTSQRVRRFRERVTEEVRDVVLGNSIGRRMAFEP